MEKEADRHARMEPRLEPKKTPKTGNMGVKRICEFIGFFFCCIMFTMCLSCILLQLLCAVGFSYRRKSLPLEEDHIYIRYFVPLNPLSAELVGKICLTDVKCYVLLNNSSNWAHCFIYDNCVTGLRSKFKHISTRLLPSVKMILYSDFAGMLFEYSFNLASYLLGARDAGPVALSDDVHLSSRCFNQRSCCNYNR